MWFERIDTLSEFRLSRRLGAPDKARFRENARRSPRFETVLAVSRIADNCELSL